MPPSRQSGNFSSLPDVAATATSDKIRMSTTNPPETDKSVKTGAFQSLERLAIGLATGFEPVVVLN